MTTTPTTAGAQQFEQLFQRSRVHAYRLAYRLTGNAADAEDVTQDAYLRAYRRFERFMPSRSFEAWLFRIITNRVIDLHRRKRLFPLFSLDTPLPGDCDGYPLAHEFASPDADPAQQVIDPLLCEQLQRALARLPEDYRTAVLLCDVEQCSYQEIADRMDCAIGTIRSRIHRARKIMRSYLESGGKESGRRAKRAAQKQAETVQTGRNLPRRPEPSGAWQALPAEW